jgi:GntR family transcriptional regulator
VPRSRYGADGSVPERRDVYEQLADDLRRAIVTGQYQPGDKLPSTLDLMERTGVANLTVRGAYRVLVEEGLVESVSKKGFYVRRPNAMTWQMNPGSGRGRTGTLVLDGWAASAEAAGLRHREEISVAIEDASALVLGIPIGDRLGLPPGSRVLVRRAVRLTGPADDSRPEAPDSLADAYYPYDLVRDSVLASPGAVSSVEVLAGLGCLLREFDDELRPRVATADERRRLQLAEVSVVLELTRTARTADRRAVLVSHQVRRGDGAIYSYHLRTTGI